MSETALRQSSAAVMDSLLREILTSRVYEVAQRDAARAGAAAVAPPRQRRAAQARGPAADLQLQDPRRLQPDRAAVGRGARAAASSPPAPATTRRASPSPPGVWACARSSSCRGRRRRSRSTRSRRSAPRSCSSGDRYAEAQQHSERLAAETGLVFVHPFDDPLVIAGQGTVARGAAAAEPARSSAVFVPVGGGGLIAGIGAYVKALQPGRPGDRRRAGRRRRDGAVARGRAPRAARRRRAVRRRRRGAAGRRAHVPDRAGDGRPRSSASNNDEICAAIKDIFDDTRTIVEPAGALALAGPEVVRRARAACADSGSPRC